MTDKEIFILEWRFLYLRPKKYDFSEDDR
jgi:hypothetical protein